MGLSRKAGKKGATSAIASIARADYRDVSNKAHAGVTDLCLLSKISDEAINENLQKRFVNKEIYVSASACPHHETADFQILKTYIGHVLISVNPFRDLGIYTSQILASYTGKNRLEMPPHVFAIAEGMVKAMNAYEENQCVIISGESGAGKTEAAKRIMQYIAEASGADTSSNSRGKGISEIKDMVLATNPLLESFGCAKTLRNDNSSRHGKYLEIFFNSSGNPVGASITNYLLEKGRVVGQIINERNFHIFYQFTKGADAQQRDTEEFGITGPETYTYISKSGCLDVPGIDDVKDFADTKAAMRTIGLSSQEQNNIFRMIAAVLWIGNVKFAPDEEGNSKIVDARVPEFIAYLLEVDEAQLRKTLTIRIMETSKGFGKRGSIYEVPLNVAQATSNRDALAKAIYNNLFEWIVDRVNVSMKAREAAARTIGILDIYGFEIFESNAFEQLCINYVNEKLQQIFIELTLKAEQEEYMREQIQWTPIDYFNNKIVCDLIEGLRPPGIFLTLNDACATAHADPVAADSSFMRRISSLSSNPHFDSRGSQFLVKHYAGDVMYTVAGMTDKNKDSLNKDLLALVNTSSNAYLQILFPEQVDPNSKKRPTTAGDKIRTSANALVEKLMKSQPSYIRTIKPNGNRSPSEYDTKAILHQIKYLGLQENIRVRRAGFASRNTFEKIVERFYLLSPKTSNAGNYCWNGDARSGCKQILTDAGINPKEWQLGVTMAFIKSPETLFALESMRDNYWNSKATIIQRCWRKHRIAHQLIRLRDQTHEVLANRKERRRYSLIAERRLAGDYLGIERTEGASLRNAASINSEKVLFSMRGEVLVSKFGRSSAPSPRFLILTNSHFYILITENSPQGLITSIQSKTSLSAIRSASLTNLQDNWMALNLGSPNEPDLFFNCIFKTELLVFLKQAAPRMEIQIGPTISYAKKKGKLVVIKAVRQDKPMQMEDKTTKLPIVGVYKSSSIFVTSGMPANSQSQQPPRRQVTRQAPSSFQKPTSVTQSMQNMKGPSSSNDFRQKSSSVNQGGENSFPSSTPNLLAAKARAPPPPRPAPSPEPASTIVWKVMYTFESDASGEVPLIKGEKVKMLEEDVDGWSRVTGSKGTGWAPANYMEKVKEQVMPPAPPRAPPRPNPAGKKMPPAPPPKPR